MDKSPDKSITLFDILPAYNDTNFVVEKIIFLSDTVSESPRFFRCKFATLSDERRSRSKIFPLFIWIKEPCVRKFEGLERSKLLGISQTKISLDHQVFWPNRYTKIPALTGFYIAIVFQLKQKFSKIRVVDILTPPDNSPLYLLNKMMFFVC